MGSSGYANIIAGVKLSEVLEVAFALKTKKIKLFDPLSGKPTKTVPIEYREMTFFGVPVKFNRKYIKLEKFGSNEYDHSTALKDHLKDLNIVSNNSDEDDDFTLPYHFPSRQVNTENYSEWKRFINNIIGVSLTNYASSYNRTTIEIDYKVLNKLKNKFTKTMDKSKAKIKPEPTLHVVATCG